MSNAYEEAEPPSAPPDSEPYSGRDMVPDVFNPNSGIDLQDLQNEFVHWSSHYATRSEAFANAEADHAAAKHKVKKLRAEKFLAILKAHERKPSDATIDAMVEADAEVQEAIRQEIDALRARARLRGELEALSGKRDMLMQLGARQRKEMDFEPRTPVSGD